MPHCNVTALAFRHLNKLAPEMTLIYEVLVLIVAITVLK